MRSPANNTHLSRRSWIAAVGAAALAACRRKKDSVLARTSGRLRQDAYVWQRLWTPGTRKGLAAAHGRFDGLTILAAEVAWHGMEPNLIRTNVAEAELLSVGCPVGIAVRIGPYAGPFDAGARQTKLIIAWIRETLTIARSGGWNPAELQIDFDAATSKLEGYRMWLALIREAVYPLPLSFTALPDWLNSPVLGSMAREAGRFVLQVHAVERARPDDKQASLIDPTKAKSWAEKAADLGVPYRIALPTYRSTAGFNSEGKIVGIESEGPARAWPEGTRLVNYSSPAGELAKLIADWTSDRPGLMEGVIWYRMPVTDESRNWTWKTLSPVMQGRPPVRSLKVLQTVGNPHDLTILNDGEDEMPWPFAIEITCHPAVPIQAGDGLGGYVFEQNTEESHRAVFRRASGDPTYYLPPGAKKALGWVRIQVQDVPYELHIELSK